MDTLLSFFADLILFTAGVLVSLAWIFVVVVGIDELLDVFRKTNEEEEPF